MYCSWNCPHLRYHHATWTDPEEYLCKIQSEPDDCTYALAEDEAEALELVTRSGWTLARVPEYLRTAEICLAAVRQDRRVFAAVPQDLRGAVAAALEQESPQDAA
jgi:predicted TPR repeat methyltransferase